LAERIANKETFYIYFFSPICPHCKRSTANVNKAFAATHATYYQYNVYEDPDAFTNFQIEGTPTTYYYKNGVLADKAIGEVSDLFGAAFTYDTFKTWLEKH
jgi:thioredoxin-like negative regulator of GroEL